MNKEIKLNSIEAGPFTKSQNRMSFEVPADGVYDLSESWVNLNVEIEIQETETASGVGIYSMGLEWEGAKTLNVPNSAMVKNARIRTARRGMIEDIRRVDQISNIVSVYNESYLQRISASYKNVTQLQSALNQEQVSLARDLNKVGVVKSTQNNTAPLKIPLSDLFDFCSQATELDTTRSGALTIALELNVDKVDPVQYNESGDWATELTGANWEPITVEGEANEIKSLWKIDSLDQSRFYVGQKLSIVSSGTGGYTPTTDPNPAVIDSIVWNADGTLSIQFEKKWSDIGAGETITSIEVSTTTIATATVNFNFGEIVLKKLAKDKSDFSTIEYSTFSTEQTNGNGLVNFQRQFQVEAEADAVIVAFPDAASDLLSQNDQLVSWRLRLDNDDLTDRDIDTLSALHYDRVNMTMSQMRITLRNLRENQMLTDNNLSAAATDEASATTILANPLNQSPQEKLLQLNINCKDASTGVTSLTLFKHLPRVFSY